MEDEVEFPRCDPAELNIAPPFSELFEILPEDREAVRKSMLARGFLKRHPILVWRQTNTVIDGHTRVDVAKELGIEVYVDYQDFTDSFSALEAGLEEQSNRRNISKNKKEQGPFAKAVLLVDAEYRKCNGGRRKGETADTLPSGISVPRGTLKTDDAPIERSAEITARLLDSSSRTVARVRSVFDSEEEDVKQAVLDNKMTVNAADKEVKARRVAKEKPTVPAKLAEALANPPKASAPFEAVPAVIPTPAKALAVPSCLGGVPETGIHTDLMAYEMIAPLLSEMRRLATERIGTPTVRTPPLFRIIWDLVTVCPPQEWTPCPACDGSGVRSGVGLCKRCNGFGYHVSHN